MAAKRISKSAIDWSELKKRVPLPQNPSYMVFKSKCDNYIKKMTSTPAEPPKIDWDHYKKHISIPGFIDSFQKSYETLTIPYPAAPDAICKDLDDQEKTIKTEIDVFKKESNSKIKEYKEQLCVLHSFIPYDQMTMEDFKDSHPDIAIDSVNKPTFWPHDAAEQMDYRDKGHPLYGIEVERH